MEAVALLHRARQAGLLVRRDGDRVIVRGPKRLGHLATELLDHKADVLAALEAESDPAVAAALAAFPGARVVSTGLPAIWPPQGGWVPSSGRAIEAYSTAAPTASCPCCGAKAWGRAGSGWCCRRCHPDPLAPCPETAEVVDAILFELARRAEFPPVLLARAVTVLPGESAWRRFAFAGSAADRATARATLRAMLGECASSEQGTPERTRV